MVTVPIFIKLDEPLVYDTSIEATEIDEIPCDKTTVEQLNQANTQFKFHYTGDFSYLLSSPDTGFIIRCRFRTRLNNANNMNANISLASNWIGYLFNDAEIRLGGQSIERINNPGIVMDVFYHMENNEFRYQNGELVGFIPDTSGEVSDTVGTRQGDLAGADAAAIIASANNAAQRNVRASGDYNDGFVRRRKLYNYTVANNDDFRELEMFIPLNRIFSFCDEVNRVLKYIPFEIILTRTANNSRCFYGAANTGMHFPEEVSGIISLTLQLERIKFRPDIASDLEKLYKKPFEVAYYKRICEQSSTQAGIQRTFGHSKTMSKDDEGNPRYVFCIFKNHADDTAQTNYQRCCHANVSSINVRYAGSVYPMLPQNADWTRNQYSRFYKEFIKVSRSLGNGNPSLSMAEFRNLYTIYAIDISAQTVVSTTNQITINVERREVPAAGVATPENPRELDAFFIIIAEAKIQIDCMNKVVRKT
jgi:hypothetical protein